MRSRTLWAMLGLALLGRLVLAALTNDNPYDLGSYRVTQLALEDGSPWDLYAQVADPPRWPYPPGYLPWLLLAPRLAFHSGISFDFIVQLPPILADVALAGLVAWMRPGLAGPALIAFSPILVYDSSIHGQLDSVPTLPALLGTWLWAREDRRVVGAALLLGLAIAIKQPLALVVLALLPSSRSPREAALLLGISAALPLLALAPFLAAEPRATVDNLTYSGLVGLGGLAVVVQPSLTEGWLRGGVGLQPSRIMDLNHWLQAAVVGGVLAVASRARRRPLDAVALMFLAVWSFTLPWSFTYLVWGLPFLVVAGQLRTVAAMNALGLPIVAILYTVPHEGGVVTLYTVLVIALWALTAAAALKLARDLIRSSHVPDR
jgi:hypothetical protein